ncbi:hypothetical protein [Stutzerimonas stutzeri]|uniref:hypothetical protein n=1 Tax=Stutzerimonas stutzeri TaxID=316 RepID=UPI0026590294|nr:hypothetical protein [Stutzerimonas stutzeri]MCF6782601.1 hypothetical protein [Stutzerimonas stutzeri]MCF6805706.1 hypothetical protein [Stutzerimonas stutzeri]
MTNTKYLGATATEADIKAAFAAHTPKTSYAKSTSDSDRNATVSGGDISMSNISREEFLSRLETTEAKVDARYSRFEASMASSLAEITKEIHSIKGQIAGDVAAARGEVAGLNGKLESVNTKVDALKGIKGNIWGAAVTVLVLAIGIVTLVINTLATGISIRSLLGLG